MSDEDSLAQAQQLAAERDAARRRRDFDTADALRDRIGQLGFAVVDAASGWQLQALEPMPPVVADDGSVAQSNRAGGPITIDGNSLGVGARALAVMIVSGWVNDAEACVRALLEYEPDVHVHIVTVGDDVGQAGWARALATSRADLCSTTALEADDGHWAAIHRAVFARCEAPYVAVLDPSTIITGDAITQCCNAIEHTHAAAVGWRGADIDRADNWRSVTSVDGDADVLLSYLMVVPTSTANAAPPSAKARFYRNADLEWSLTIRQWWFDVQGEPASLIALGDVLPAMQLRHHGYHDTDPDYRDRESRVTYNRLLKRFRGHDEILRRR